MRRKIDKNVSKKLSVNRFLLMGLGVGMIIGLLLVVVGMRNLKEQRPLVAISLSSPNEIGTTIVPTVVPTAIPVPKSLRLPIVMYHYVEYVKEANDLVKKKLTINPALFEQQLKSFQQEGYVTYFVKEVPDILEGKIKLAPRSVVLTFDDGYEDFYTVVAPLLAKYHMKATQYVIYNYIGRKGFLTKQEVVELAKNPFVEIGSHTLDHIYLKTATEAVARKQIIESKTKLEALTGIPIETFAYPYGSYAPHSSQIVQEAGYTVAVGTNLGVIQSIDNRYTLTRVRAGALVPGHISQLFDKIQK